jgi:hypothetical protein
MHAKLHSNGGTNMALAVAALLRHCEKIAPIFYKSQKENMTLVIMS